MNKVRVAIFLIGLVVCLIALYSRVTSIKSVAAAQTQRGSADGIWQPAAADKLTSRKAVDLPTSARSLRLDSDALSRVLNTAASETSNGLSASQTILSLPLPNGEYLAFRIEESSVLDAQLTKKFPEIKSYRGVAVDDAQITMRADWTPQGLHALILTPQGAYTVIPTNQDTTSEYVTFDAGTAPPVSEKGFECLAQESPEAQQENTRVGRQFSSALASVGSTRRNYRIAISTTYEYSLNYGSGTVAGTVASLNTWLNGINAIYERELNIHLNLVDAPSVLFTSSSDPYANGDSLSMLSQVRTVLRDQVGQSNYDIGHVLGTGGAGVAWVGVVCNNNADSLGPIKGGGVSCINGSLGSPSLVNLISHELGHQFGAFHSFNASTGSCGSNRSAASGVEPGSGTTIMSYAGLCGSDNVAAASDLRFHAWSFAQINNYVTNGTGNTCATQSSTGNTAPIVNGGNDYTIPAQTPFELTATGSDANASDIPNLTYTWEQVDAGNNFGNPPYTDQNDGDYTTRPLFRPYGPSASPSRTFPALTYILNNANTPPATTTSGYQTADFLSYRNRLLHFRVVARDQRGGVTDDEVELTVNANAGPFLVTAPNTNVTWPGGSTQTVTWSVNNTNAAPISCASVRIQLSTDGGLTFPITLVSSTANDGSESVTVPSNLLTSTARVRVQAIGNVFFDISNTNFSIMAGGTCPVVSSINPSMGVIGTTVTIAGTNFTGVTAVRFGTANASFTVMNDATIQATVPAGASGGPITIVKTNCSNTQTPAFALCTAAPSNLQVDDGTIEQTLGYPNGMAYFLNRMTPSTYPATLSTVTVAINRPAGTSFEIVVGTNTDGNADINGTPFQTINAVSPGALQFVTVNVPTTTINSGDFVVGYRITSVSGVYPAAIDNSSSSQQRSYASITGTSFSSLDSMGFPGNLTIRTSVFTGSCSTSGPVTVTTGLQFYPLSTPVRLLDTRPGGSPNACSQPNTPIAGGTSRTQPGRNICGIPSTALALTGNITTLQSGGGYLTLYPSNAAQPFTANTNFSPNQILNNVFTVGLGTDGAFNIYATSNTDVLVDVTGYYALPGAGGLYFHPLPAPVRLLETRPGQLGYTTPGTMLAGNTDTTQVGRNLTYNGIAIPAAAQALVGNVTTVNPSSGYLTLYAQGSARPPVASSNYNSGDIMNGPFTVRLGSTGQFMIYVSSATHLVVDVLGYYSAEATDVNGTGLLFSPLPSPVRLLDTRVVASIGCSRTGASLLAGSTRTQAARNTCTIPATAQGLVGNTTTVNPLNNGYLTFFPGSVLTPPLVATSNYLTGQVFNRYFLVGLGNGDGAFKIFTYGTTNLVVDVSGYFAP